MIQIQYRATSLKPRSKGFGQAEDSNQNLQYGTSPSPLWQTWRFKGKPRRGTDYGLPDSPNLTTTDWRHRSWKQQRDRSLSEHKKTFSEHYTAYHPGALAPQRQYQFSHLYLQLTCHKVSALKELLRSVHITCVTSRMVSIYCDHYYIRHDRRAQMISSLGTSIHQSHGAWSAGSTDSLQFCSLKRGSQWTV